MGSPCRWAGDGAGRVGRAITGWFLLVLAVMVTQAVAVWPAVAQDTPAPFGAASDTILAWGSNFFGELGNGTTTNSSTPVAVSLPADTAAVAIAAGDAHSVALTAAGTVLAWGDNSHGQLGDGTGADSLTPVGVNLPAGVTASAVAAGRDHSVALTSAGAVLAWGGNSFGQLGDGTVVDRSTPVAVALPPSTTVTAVAAGGNHSVALTSAGTALAWGRNFFGQLGDGTVVDRSTPTVVSLPAGVTASAVAAGRIHSLALTTAGGVLAWGNNTFGQLGDGTTTTSSTPVSVTLPAATTITAISARDSQHSVAMTSAGAALSWGRNLRGQLGDGTTTNRSTPVDVDLPAGVTVTAIAAGDDHSLALTAPPTSTTTLQVTPANPTADQDITLTATVTCNVDTPTGTITLRTNGETLTTVPLTTSATATHTTTLPTGTHALTAHYTSINTCPNSQSPPTTITINPDLPITGPTLTTTGAATLSILAGAILIYAARRLA
ncbi:cell wall anchor protein [Salinispora arenicola]|uniref:RCC1 domain-containing protein n=1 Tax=Salinispora arenicola TaxID=168697 RepID=UPI001431CF84|nr:RCC1 domain-containing protein [Salinispora arenicola]NIL44149.1 cell wall anchor protein [Salinispora arenicola]